jgi:DNA-binding LytR/AlgR family response regulator
MKKAPEPELHDLNPPSMSLKRSILRDVPVELVSPKPALRRDRPRPIIRSLNKSVAVVPEELIVPAPHVVHDASAPPVYFIKDMRGLVRIDPAHIQFLQADGNYVELHLPQRRVVLRNSLAEVLKMLPPCLMCQVNRAQAVNIQHLDLIGTDEVRIGELAFTLSKHYREPLLACVQVISGR